MAWKRVLELRDSGRRHGPRLTSAGSGPPPVFAPRAAAVSLVRSTGSRRSPGTGGIGLDGLVLKRRTGLRGAAGFRGLRASGGVRVGSRGSPGAGGDRPERPRPQTPDGLRGAAPAFKVCLTRDGRTRSRPRVAGAVPGRTRGRPRSAGAVPRTHPRSPPQSPSHRRGRAGASNARCGRQHDPTALNHRTTRRLQRADHRHGPDPPTGPKAHPTHRTEGAPHPPDRRRGQAHRTDGRETARPRQHTPPAQHRSLTRAAKSPGPPQPVPASAGSRVPPSPGSTPGTATRRGPGTASRRGDPSRAGRCVRASR